MKVLHESLGVAGQNRPAFGKGHGQQSHGGGQQQQAQPAVGQKDQRRERGHDHDDPRHAGLTGLRVTGDGSNNLAALQKS